MKRRTFLRIGALSAAGACLSATDLLKWTPRAHAATVTKTLFITDGFIAQPGGVDVYFQGFSDSSTELNVPANHLIVQEGDTVSITVVNTLSSSHSFVIDGLVDSGPIQAGETRTFQFVAGAPGSYLFHDNLNAPYNRLLGLHGGLAVMPLGSSTELYLGSPTFVNQHFWVINEIDPLWNESLRNGAIPTTAFTPRYFTINGLSSRPPGAPGYDDPNINAMTNLDTVLHGHIGDRTLIRILNAGMCEHSMHWHANHVEWLTKNGEIRPDVWKKDSLRLDNNMGALDAIFPFEPPPDAWPPVTTGMFPMHLHDEMTQTAGGGFYLFGAMTEIVFE